MQHHVLLYDLTFKQFGKVDKFRLADIHVSHLSSGGTGVLGTLGRACKSSYSGCSVRKICLSASVPALGRTRHPFAVSGLEEPSQNVWSAALSQAKNDDDGMVCANVYGLCWSNELLTLMECAALSSYLDWQSLETFL